MPLFVFIANLINHHEFASVKLRPPNSKLTRSLKYIVLRAMESNLVVSFDKADAHVSEDNIIVDKEGGYVYAVSQECMSARKKERGNREDAIITDQCEMAQSEVCGVINPVLNHCPSKRAARKLAGAFMLDKSLVSGWRQPRRLCIR